MVVNLTRATDCDHRRPFLRAVETPRNMREIVHLQAGQCGNQIGAKVITAAVCVYAGFALHNACCIKVYDCMTRNQLSVHSCFFTNNFTCNNCVCFSKSMSQLCLFMRHTIIQNCIHVEITYVFDTCKINFFIIIIC